MAELARLGYGVAVVGPVLGYLVVGAVRWRRPAVLLALAGLAALVAAVPGPVLAAAWLVWAVAMALSLTVMLAYTVVSARLLLPVRPVGGPTENPGLPTVAVLVAARDEAGVIGACLDSVLRADYPAERLRVIVIDDGSTDATAAIVSGYATANRHVRLVVRAPDAARGKAAALNDILFALDTDYVAILDSDHQIATDFFRTTLRYLADPALGGVQVRTVGRNWARNTLTGLAEMELLGWQYCFVDVKSRAGLFTPALGSGCVFRTAALQQVGGFDNSLAVEDLDASFRLYRAGRRIVFCSRTYTTHEVIADLPGFFRQRYRWTRGTIQSVRAAPRAPSGGRRVGLPQRLDTLLYPALIVMMVVPALQLATHALSTALRVRLSHGGLVVAGYAAVIVFCHLVAGLRNRSQADGLGPRRAAHLLPLSVGMCAYYAVLLSPTLTLAILDELVLRSRYERVKAHHQGQAGR